jgi:hypothetical protein
MADRLSREALEPGVTSDALSGAGGALTQFRIQVRDLTAESFPPPSEPARLAAGAFLNAARSFAHVLSEPEARTACAPLLREAARYVDHLWTLHRTALAQGSWAGRQFGEG